MSNPNGPRNGQTPADDSDLHDSDNPYSASSPKADLTDDTNHGFNTPGMPSGYYSPPAITDTDNPYSGGVGTYTASESSLADYLGLGLVETYLDSVSTRQPARSGEDSPDASVFYNDQGYGPTGTGRS